MWVFLDEVSIGINRLSKAVWVGLVQSVEGPKSARAA